ncbi:AsmA family protein [Halomonas sp. YLGW01]|uniref:AsmA family protein n=1 Tax=Halomonas sp. YLGW01 TaxID=2773308 RepID=UPI00177C04C2|nr:AsmA family protein [Halomonas sp. YLGW01]
MRALLRTLLAVVGILGLVVVGAVVYITTFFDPEDLKPHLVQVARDQSGLELKLDGPLAWSFYPRLGLSVADAEARLPDQPENEQAFLAFEQAEVSLAFAPLLSGKVAIDGLSLDGMRLNLKRDAEGRGNWQTLVNRLERQQEQAALEAEAAPAVVDAENDADSGEITSELPAELGGELGGENGIAVALDIARVSLTDGSIRYSDRQSGQAWHIDALNISGTNVTPAKAFPLSADFTLSSFLIPQGQSREAAAQWVSQLTLKSRVRLGLDDGRYALEGLTLDTATRLEGADGQQQKVNLAVPSLEADLAAGRYVLKGGKLDASLAHSALGEKALPLSLTFAADADLEAQTLRISEWQLSGENSLKLGGNLRVEQLLEAPQYRGQLTLAPLSLRTWLERLGSLPETADDAALGSLALSSPLEGDLERVSLPSLNLTLDDTTLSGSLSAGLDGRSLALDLQGDVLNLDRYLPPVEEGSGHAQASAQGEASGQAATGDASQAGAAAVSQAGGELVPVATLKALDLKADLAFERLTVKGMDLEQVVLEARGGSGQQRLERFDARFFDGTLAASAGLDLRETPLRWRFAPKIEGVAAAPFIAALTSKESPLRGRLNLSGELTARGNSAGELPARLNGQLNARIVDGAVLNVNVSEELCTAVALLEGKQTSRDWHADTRFDRAAATLNIRDGEVRNDDLEISIPGIQVTGEGKVGLVDKRLDYRAAARFVDTADAACEVNPRLTKVPLPVRCEGSLSGAPADWCGFDRGAFRDAVAKLARQEVEAKAGEEVKKRLDDALEGLDKRIGEGASGELRDALKGLFQ